MVCTRCRFCRVCGFRGVLPFGDTTVLKYNGYGMLTEQLDYPLDPGHIAHTPAEPRDVARLFVVDRLTDRVRHVRVRDLPDLRAGLSDDMNAPPLLAAGDLLVFNQSKVLPAQFTGVRMGTGGRVGGLFLDDSREGGGRLTWTLMLKSGGRLGVGEGIELSDGTVLRLVERGESGRWVAGVESDDDTMAILGRVGTTPLPEYIRRAREQAALPEAVPSDAERYNTVYANDPGSVAAPTAGLHFTPGLIQRLAGAGVRTAMLTLHVGIGTFSPVRTERVDDHPIHGERVFVPEGTIGALRRVREEGGRIIPVGTTTVRALESLPDPLPGHGGFHEETRLLITPRATASGTHLPYPFRFTDGLMTNFHLPRSTLLAMVAALPAVGIDRLKGWYGVAVERGYRFYSYGDAMLII